MSARRSAPAIPVLMLVLVALVSQGCGIAGSITGPRGWTLGTTNSDGTATTTQVNDTSGLVRDIELDPPDARPGPVVAVAPAQPNALDVTWAGGVCDDRTTIDITAAGAGLSVTVRTHQPDRPCDAMATQRVIRLQFAQPLAPGMVAVHQ
jgi:hypothetical protein